jgi:ADP-heptose:LPS heptosyltransferase
VSNNRAGPGALRTDRQSLLIFPGALGDLICFLPALEAIAERDRSRPVLLCKSDLGPLVEAAELAKAEAIEGREVAWLFSANPPDEAERYIRRFAAVECFTGFGDAHVERNLRRWKGTAGRVHPFRPPATQHLALHFLECIGVRRSELPEVRVRLPSTALLEAQRKFSQSLARRPRLVAHPGSGGSSKRWSREGFVRITENWCRSRGGVVIALGPAEEAERPFWESRPLSVAAALDLVGLASLLTLADVYLGNDSGASHLAAAAGCRGLVVFGPTDPARWRPLSQKLRPFSPSPWTACDEKVSDHVIRTVEQELAADAEGDLTLTRNGAVISLPTREK